MQPLDIHALKLRRNNCCEFLKMPKLVKSTVYHNNLVCVCYSIIYYDNNAGGTTTSGELSNHIRMENCSFSENSATEYGAAVCVSSLLFLQPTFNIPPIIIVNRCVNQYSH